MYFKWWKASSVYSIDCISPPVKFAFNQIVWRCICHSKDHSNCAKNCIILHDIAACHTTKLVGTIKCIPEWFHYLLCKFYSPKCYGYWNNIFFQLPPFSWRLIWENLKLKFWKGPGIVLIWNPFKTLAYNGYENCWSKACY